MKYVMKDRLDCTYWDEDRDRWTKQRAEATVFHSLKAAASELVQMAGGGGDFVIVKLKPKAKRQHKVHWNSDELYVNGMLICYVDTNTAKGAAERLAGQLGVTAVEEL